MLTCLPATVLCMRGKDMKLLGQQQKTLLKLMATAVARVSTCSCTTFLRPNTHRVIERMVGDSRTLWIALEEGNSEFKEHNFFYIMGNKNACSFAPEVDIVFIVLNTKYNWSLLWREKLYIFQGCKQTLPYSSVRHYLPVHSTSNLEKIIWNEYSQCFY